MNSIEDGRSPRVVISYKLIRGEPSRKLWRIFMVMAVVIATLRIGKWDILLLTEVGFQDASILPKILNLLLVIFLISAVIPDILGNRFPLQFRRQTKGDEQTARPSLIALVLFLLLSLTWLSISWSIDPKSSLISSFVLTVIALNLVVTVRVRWIKSKNIYMDVFPIYWTIGTTYFLSLILILILPELMFEVGRFRGLFGNANWVAIIGPLIAVMSLANLMNAKKSKARSLHFIVLTSVLLSVGLSSSRGGLLTVAVGISLYLLSRKFSIRQLMLPALSLLTSISFLLVIDAFLVNGDTPIIRSSIAERLVPGDSEAPLAGNTEALLTGNSDPSMETKLNNLGDRVDSYTSGRLSIWQTSANAISDRWLLGYGIGTSQIATQTGYETHNFLIGVWLELGLLGIILGLFLCILLCLELRNASALMRALIAVILFGSLWESYLLGFGSPPFLISSLVIAALLAEKRIRRL